MPRGVPGVLLRDIGVDAAHWCRSPYPQSANSSPDSCTCRCSASRTQLSVGAGTNRSSKDCGFGHRGEIPRPARGAKPPAVITGRSHSEHSIASHLQAKFRCWWLYSSHTPLDFRQQEYYPSNYIRLNSEYCMPRTNIELDISAASAHFRDCLIPAAKNRRKMLFRRFVAGYGCGYDDHHGGSSNSSSLPTGHPDTHDERAGEPVAAGLARTGGPIV